MPTFKILFFGVAIAALLAACKSSQPARPQEFYNDVQLEVPNSTIKIPVKLYKNELLQAINNQIGDVLYDDSNMKDDGMMVKAKKKENITINISDTDIKYRVPVELWIRKDMMLSDVEAEGSLALNFTTKYHIKEDWSLETATELSGFDWLKQPVVKLGFADLPVTSIANLVLNQSKKEFAKSIDKQVKNVFDLKKEIETAWKSMKMPFLMSEEYKTWLLLNPQAIEMTPLRTNGNMLQSTITITSKPQIFLGEKPAEPAGNKLPAFRYGAESADQFEIFLDTDVSFKEAERISRQNMVGQVFTYGKKSVMVEDIKLFGQGNKMVVDLKTKGSYNGNIYFIAKPVYNANKNKVELEEVDFDFSTQKALLKSASWLFKGPIRKQVQENLDFYLNHNLEDTKKLMQDQLKDYPIAPGVNVNGLLDELSVSNVYVSTNSIKVRIGLKGTLGLDVKGLGF